MNERKKLSIHELITKEQIEKGTIKDNKNYPDHDQSAMIPPNITEIFGKGADLSKMKSAFHIPNGTIKNNINSSPIPDSPETYLVTKGDLYQIFYAGMKEIDKNISVEEIWTSLYGAMEEQLIFPIKQNTITPQEQSQPKLDTWEYEQAQLKRTDENEVLKIELDLSQQSKTIVG